MILKLLMKDIRVLASEKKSLLVLVMMPIVLTTILSFSLRGNFDEEGLFETVQIGIVKAYDANAEREKFLSKVSPYMSDEEIRKSEQEMDFERIFFENFLDSEAVKSILEYQIMSDEMAETALDEGRVAAVFYLPKGFIYNQMIDFTLPNRNEIEVKMLANPESQYGAMIAESVLKGYFSEMEQRIAHKNAFIEVGASYLDLNTLFKSLPEIMGESEERSEADAVSAVNYKTLHGNRHIDSFAYYSIAMMSMFILYASGHTGRTLLREQKMLTLDRSSVAGVTKAKVIASKFLMTVVLSAVQMSLLLVFAKFVLKVDWQRPLLILVGILASAVAVSGVGIFISAIALRQGSFKVANIFENVLIHIFALIGGSYVPLDALPSFALKFKGLALNGTVLDLFLGIYKGMTFEALIPYLGMLLIIGLLFSAGALWIVLKREAAEYA